MYKLDFSSFACHYPLGKQCIVCLEKPEGPLGKLLAMPQRERKCI